MDNSWCASPITNTAAQQDIFDISQNIENNVLGISKVLMELTPHQADYVTNQVILNTLVGGETVEISFNE